MATGHSTCAVRIRGYIAFLGSALLFLALMAAVTLPAAAQSAPQFTQTADDPFAAAVQALDARKFSDKAKAIDALGVLGDERAIVVLQAFADGRLYRRKADKAVIIGDRDGDGFSLTSPVTGATAGTAASGEIKKIIANNKLRGQIRGVLGQLALFSPNADDRLDAARNVIASPTEDALGLLKRARDRETVSKIRATLESGIAVLELASDDRALRLAAVATLADRSDPNIKSALEQRLLKNNGEFTEPDAEVRAALREAVDDIDDRLALFGLVENLIFGLSLGSVLLLAAIGLAITFGVMGVINMAHGEMIMLGAYTTFVVQEIFRSTMPPELFGMYVLVSIPAAFFVAAAFGVLIERGCIRFLYGRPLETLLATWGVSLILQQLVRTVFGANNQEVANPDWISGAVAFGGGVSVTVSRIYIIIFCLMVVAALAAFIRYSRFGLQMRAVTQNRGMASAMGIRTGQVDALTFALGSGIAGVAGVALSQISNVSPNLGQNFVVDSFMVVVFGGVGSLWGTIVGAFSLGIVNKFLEPVSGAILGKVVVLVIIILFIQRRPRGLFALKGRAADS
ncbi:MAG: urea ABC transporter permease subunit UrtB [Rhodospirillaceae bacterium]|jgi:urea transport system permease protein|nr:urea ABC transporter permease subunit UrtB [Rhodospirillaceae bacterium]MBT3807946.1 urea ABC transporter permease subunit UrtB [Rhodospirillaceae bacterium]MBT4772400.1 urea ABC transporter permease subunit UrtB [Rhodospirillaceae bacterium]MBT5359654.1 urea ABC transporter permease subunit UrtB [Rhodospirillaceae bacterium]MBT5769882.1 urea ABC transporter permease subunit UrtB [Rhodospirillaceae bacterium]